MKRALYLVFLFDVWQLLAADIVLRHMPEGNQCIICHAIHSPQRLFLRDGTRVDPGKVDVLCGQCHGVKHRDWSEGGHGKLAIHWQAGKGRRFSCIECHDPHSPKFPQMQAAALSVRGNQ